jgi:hypothetical protein
MGLLVIDRRRQRLDRRAIAADCSEVDAAWMKNKEKHQEKFMPI